MQRFCSSFFRAVALSCDRLFNICDWWDRKRRRKRRAPSLWLRGFLLREIIFIRGQTQCDGLTNLQHYFWHLRAVWKHAGANVLLAHRGNMFGLPGVELRSHSLSWWEDCSHVLLNAPPKHLSSLMIWFHQGRPRDLNAPPVPPPAASYSHPLACGYEPLGRCIDVSAPPIILARNKLLHFSLVSLYSSWLLSNHRRGCPAVTFRAAEKNIVVWLLTWSKTY